MRRVGEAACSPSWGQPRLQAAAAAIVKARAAQRTDDTSHAMALFFSSNPVTPALPACK